MFSAAPSALILSGLLTSWFPTDFRWSTGDLPVPYCISANSTRTSLSQTQQRQEIELAIRQWVTTAAGGASPCGYNARAATYSCNTSISLNDNKNNIFFNSTTWQHGSQTLGVTHLGGSGNCGSASGYQFYCFSAPDIELNDVHVTWRNNGSSTDIASIASHEYGHFIGLGHCNEGGSPRCNIGQAIMYAAYSGGRWYQPASDDVAGACALYPPINPGAVGYPCTGSGVCTSGVCVNPGATGYCSQTCGSCPAGFACGPNPQNAGQQVCLRDDGTNKGLCEVCRQGAANACRDNGFCGFAGLPENDVTRCVTPCPNPNGPDGGCPTNYGCYQTQQGNYCFPKSSDCTNLTNFSELPFGATCDGSIACVNGGTCIGICSTECTGAPGQGSCPTGYACEVFSFQQGDFPFCAPVANEGESCAGVRACPTGPCLSTGIIGPTCYRDCAGNPGACNNAQTCTTYNLQGGGSVAICEPPGVPPRPDLPDAGTQPRPDAGGPGADGGSPEDGAVPVCSCDVSTNCDPNCSCDPACLNACTCDVSSGCDQGCACDQACGPTGTCACDTDFCCTAGCACDAECGANCACDLTTTCDPDCTCDPECQPGCPGFRDPNAQVQTKGGDCRCVSTGGPDAPSLLGLSLLGLLALVSRRRRLW